MADDSSELAGPSGELLGEAIGDAIASGNYAKIQELLNELKQGYANLPGATPVGPVPVGRSQMDTVVEDPRYSQAENEALRSLMGIANAGGMSDADKAKLDRAKLAGLAVARGMKGGTEDSLRRRGLYSSGASIANDLASQQGGINTAYQGDVATAAAASDRALEALKAGGTMANQLGSRDLTQKDMAAQANDRIQQFNAARMDTAGMYNSGLAQANALARLKGMGATDEQISRLLASLAKQASTKGGGYGRQAGDLFGAATDGKGGGGTEPTTYGDPNEWNSYPGEDPNVYGGYKLTEADDAASLGTGDEFANLFL